ncbi:MAG TPA: RidA family protein [Telluria sp.]|nr:RidA family protein [Telluria sp.]
MNTRESVLALAVLAILFALPGAVAAPLKEIIVTKNAPAAIGPYSQGVRAGTMLFVAGQIPIDPRTGQLNTGTDEEQVAQVLENIKAILAADGMTMDNVVSTTVFVRDLNNFTKLNAVYGTYFKDKPPARATVQAARLPRDAAVEISAIAVK